MQYEFKHVQRGRAMLWGVSLLHTIGGLQKGTRQVSARDTASARTSPRKGTWGARSHVNREGGLQPAVSGKRPEVRLARRVTACGGYALRSPFSLRSASPATDHSPKPKRFQVAREQGAITGARDSGNSWDMRHTAEPRSVARSYDIAHDGGRGVFSNRRNALELWSHAPHAPTLVNLA